MPGDLVFYTNPMSRGRIVRWMLEEVGQPYRTEIGGFHANIKSDRNTGRSTQWARFRASAMARRW